MTILVANTKSGYFNQLDWKLFRGPPNELVFLLDFLQPLPKNKKYQVCLSHLGDFRPAPGSIRRRSCSRPAAQLPLPFPVARPGLLAWVEAACWSSFWFFQLLKLAEIDPLARRGWSR